MPADILGPMRLPLLCLTLPLLAACAPPPHTVTAPAAPPAQPPAQAQPEGPVREADEYTRYELLEPGSAQFHILFEVTAIEQLENATKVCGMSPAKRLTQANFPQCLGDASPHAIEPGLRARARPSLFGECLLPWSDSRG